MEVAWTKEEADKLAEKYHSFASKIESKTLKDLILKGMRLFFEFPPICKEALSVADAQLNKYQEILNDPDLLMKIDLLRTVSERHPHAHLPEFDARREGLIIKISEMQSRYDEFFMQYKDLFSVAFREYLLAAKALNNKLDDRNFSRDLSESVLLDLGGLLIPGLGTANLLKQRVLKSSEYLHRQLQNSAYDADSFSIFSDFMEIITQKVKDGRTSLVEELEVFINFVSHKLPAEIHYFTALKL